jgi:hypothetical protein
VLRKEILHKWRLPWKLYLTIITCSVGAAVQGWDQTGSNGATLFFPAYYGIDGKSARDEIVSLRVGCPYPVLIGLTHRLAGRPHQRWSLYWLCCDRLLAV